MTIAYHTNNLQTIKDQVDLRDVVSHFWGQPASRRRQYDVYASRWRDDGHRPSFTVYADSFKDYGGGGDSGDLFTFLQRELSLDFRDALTWVHDYTQHQPVAVSPQARPAARRPHNGPPDTRWQAAAARALAQSQACLWSDRLDAQAARAYLNKRGLSDDTIQRAGYGYNPDWVATDWINPDTGRAAWLAPGVIEPWHFDGHLWALRVRCRVGTLSQALGIRPDTNRSGQRLPKYLNLVGSQQRGAIFNGDAITDDSDLLITEGGFDAALAGQLLADQPIQAITFGSASMQPAEHLLERVRRAGRIYLMLDADEAGRSQSQHLQTLLGDRAVTIQLPDGQDLTDFVLAGGDLAAALRRADSQPWWRDGVPDHTRSALLNYFQPSTAPVVELINDALVTGLIDGGCFSLTDLQQASDRLGYGLASATIWRVIRALDGYFFSKLESDKSVSENASRNEKKSGRPAQYYHTLPLSTVKGAILAWAAPRIYERFHPTEGSAPVAAQPTAPMLRALGFADDQAQSLCSELADALRCGLDEVAESRFRRHRGAVRAIAALRERLDEHKSTPLPPEWTLSSAASYRAAFLRATNNPRQRRSRRQICSLLGIADSSIASVVYRAGLRARSPQGEFVERPLSPSGAVDGQIMRVARQVRGYPRYVRLVRRDRLLEQRSYTGESSHEWIRERLARGYRVLIAYQLANTYESVSSQPPPPRPVIVRSSVPIVKERRRSARYYGVGHSPRWLRGQWRLWSALIREPLQNSA